MVVNTPPQAPDVTEVVSQYYPYDVVDAEEEVIRDGWGRCVQLDVRGKSPRLLALIKTND